MIRNNQENFGNKYECIECNEEKHGAPFIMSHEVEDVHGDVCGECAGDMIW